MALPRTAPSPYAGFVRRLAAYVIDIVPIVLVTFLFSYFFLGFDEAVTKRFEESQTRREKIRFALDRNMLRFLNMGLWIIYGAVAEASPLQGTMGKRLLGMKVFRDDGHRPTWRDAFLRNSYKLVSAAPLGLGFLWAIFHKEKKTWHDKMANTSVIKTSYLRYSEAAR